MNLSQGQVVALQALRAGPITSAEACERWPAAGTNHLYALCRLDLAAHDDGLFTITAAGRAACPLRNPLAAHMAASSHQLKESPMTTPQLTRQQVLAVLRDAGIHGCTRAALVASFPNSNEPDVSYHLSQLKKLEQATNPSRGRWVATDLGPTTPPQTVKLPPTATVNPENPPKSEPPAVIRAEPPSPAVQALAAAPANDRSPDQSKVDERPPAPAESFCYTPTLVAEITDPEDVEFAIFSSGGLDIYDGDTTITLSKAVLAKLRGFLGLFNEVR